MVRFQNQSKKKADAACIRLITTLLFTKHTVFLITAGYTFRTGKAAGHPSA